MVYTVHMVRMAPIAVRVSAEMQGRLDALAEKLSARAGGAEVKRSDVARLAMERGLDVLEAEFRRKR